MPLEVVLPGRIRSQDEGVTVPTMAEMQRLVQTVAILQAIVTVLVIVIAMSVQTWILFALLG